MKKFEEDKSDSQEMKMNEPHQTNPEFMKKLQCLESSETSSKIEKIFMSDVKYKKIVALNALKKVEESKNNINNGSPSETNTNSSLQQLQKNKDIIVVNVKKKELSKENRYEINIVDYIKIQFIYSYYKYGILIYDRETNKSTKVYRRYCEFENLRQILINKYVCVYAPPLPGKILFNFLEKNLAEKRKKFLQIFLHELQYLIYYFYDSPEIKDFLDPKIEYYNSNPTVNVSLLLKQNINDSFQSIVEFSEISKKTFVSHLQNIHDKIILKLRENDMNMKEKLTDIIVKSYPPKIIQKNRNNILMFTELIKKDNDFNDSLLIKLKNIKKAQKKYFISENNFYKKLNNFRRNYENNINNIYSNSYKYDSNNNSNSNNYNNKACNISNNIGNLKEKKRIEIENYLNNASKRHYYIFLKNIYDWLIREGMINKAYIDSFSTLDYFEDKLRDVKDSVKRIKMMKHKINKKEELEKYIYMNKLLNQIVILNTIYLRNVRIDRYKYSRFQLYYNALKFSVEKNKLELDMQNKISDFFFLNEPKKSLFK